MKFRRNLDNYLDKIQTKFRENLDKFRQNLDNAQKIQSMSDIDIFEKKLDKIQTCQEKFRHNLDKFRTHTKFQKFSINLDKFRTPRFTDAAIKVRGKSLKLKSNGHHLCSPSPAKILKSFTPVVVTLFLPSARRKEAKR